MQSRDEPHPASLVPSLRDGDTHAAYYPFASSDDYARLRASLPSSTSSNHCPTRKKRDDKLKCQVRDVKDRTTGLLRQCKNTACEGMVVCNWHARRAIEAVEFLQDEALTQEATAGALGDILRLRGGDGGREGKSDSDDDDDDDDVEMKQRGRAPAAGSSAVLSPAQRAFHAAFQAKYLRKYKTMLRALDDASEREHFPYRSAYGKRRIANQMAADLTALAWDDGARERLRSCPNNRVDSGTRCVWWTRRGGAQCRNKACQLLLVCQAHLRDALRAASVVNDEEDEEANGPRAPAMRSEYREEQNDWELYDHTPTGSEAPATQPYVMSDDGSAAPATQPYAPRGAAMSSDFLEEMNDGELYDTPGGGNDGAAAAGDAAEHPRGKEFRFGYDVKDDDHDDHNIRIYDDNVDDDFGDRCSLERALAEHDIELIDTNRPMATGTFGFVYEGRTRRERRPVIVKLNFIAHGARFGPLQRTPRGDFYQSVRRATALGEHNIGPKVLKHGICENSVDQHHGAVTIGYTIMEKAGITLDDYIKTYVVRRNEGGRAVGLDASRYRELAEQITALEGKMRANGFAQGHEDWCYPALDHDPDEPAPDGFEDIEDNVDTQQRYLLQLKNVGQQIDNLFVNSGNILVQPAHGGGGAPRATVRFIDTFHPSGHLKFQAVDDATSRMCLKSVIDRILHDERVLDENIARMLAEVDRPPDGGGRRDDRPEEEEDPARARLLRAVGPRMGFASDADAARWQQLVADVIL